MASDVHHAHFALAPMTAELRIMTWFLFLLPSVFAYVAWTTPLPLLQWIMGGTTVFILLAYAGVYFAFRPTSFEISDEGLRIEWPMRTRLVPAAQIRRARIVSSQEFRGEHGFGMRIGVGGLWGGFGLLKTKTETFSMWISRSDRFVLIDLDGERPLMITPVHEERFLELLQRIQRA